MARFAMVPMIAASDTRMGKLEFRVLIAIIGHAGKDGECHPKRKTLAKITGVPITRISTITSKLQSLGWLKKVGNGGRGSPSKYQIITPETVTKTVTVTKSETVTDLVTKTVTKTVTRKEQTNEQNKPPVVPQCVDTTAWDEWDEYRRTHRLKKVREDWTDLAKKKTANLLAELSPENQRRCVNHSIANSYQGIFPDKYRNETHNHTPRKSAAEINHDTLKEIAAEERSREDPCEDAGEVWPQMDFGPPDSGDRQTGRSGMERYSGRPYPPGNHSGSGVVAGGMATECAGVSESLPPDPCCAVPQNILEFTAAALRSRKSETQH